MSEPLIKMHDLSRKTALFRSELEHAVGTVLDSGWYVLGQAGQRFESAFAEAVGVKYAIGVASGTDAIELALRALGIQSGDLVATVANAGAYTTTALLAIGAIPYYMDVQITTHHPNFDEVLKAVKVNVKAVVLTHLYGSAVQEIQQMKNLCKKHGVPLLEDCAQAHGAKIDGRYVGSFGDVASFSFYPTKNLGAFGDGGMVTTSQENISKRLLQLRQYGWDSKYKIGLHGGRNSRLDEIQAAILMVFLPHLHTDNERRRQIAQRYSTQIVHPWISVPQCLNDSFVAHLYVIQTSRRDELQKYLMAHGIASDIHYPVADHQQKIMLGSCSSVHLPATEELAGRVLSLPCYPELRDEEIARVISTLRAWGS